MKKTQQRIQNLDLFDETISLWQLLPTTGSGLQTLKHIVDAELNSKIDRRLKPLSLLITGASGKRTLARAFLRALGIEYINEIPANLLGSSQSMVDFFYASSPSNGYIISDAEKMWQSSTLNIYQILNSGEFRLYNQIKQCKEHFPVFGTVIITATKKESIPPSLQRSMEFCVETGEFNHEQLLLAILQRIRYANLSYESEEVLQNIAEYGNGELVRIVEFLKLCIYLLRKENEHVLTLKVVEQASRLMP